ncbi:ABC transporter ATP-binding protein [Paracoccus sp. (in: a-proteobacteria)]|uniref:ABC transporter ATP-binding protein n=1 Tax=Paracoccus sp. TaxID=267 RepID=UPI003A871483
MAAIDIDGLSKRFGQFQALSGISLTVAEGEFVTLLGPSGCGKTTLLKLISGFLEPNDGTISIGGKDVTRTPPEARDTALCFQSYALFPHLTVCENLEFGLRQKRLPADERKTRVGDVAEMLSLTAQLDKLPNQLSGGQQQRVSLGRALAMRPGVILFDEPLSNLDAKLRDQVRIEIRRITRDFGLTAIYVTHDQAEALAMSDRVVVLNGGKVEQLDTPEALYHSPRTPFVADFIGGANLFDGIVRGQVAGDLWQLDTPAGTFLARNSGQAPNGKVTVGWRPEHAVIGTEGIPARVIHRAFQGHFTDLTLEANGIPFRVQMQETDVREGDQVHVAIAPERILALEARA